MTYRFIFSVLSLAAVAVCGVPRAHAADLIAPFQVSFEGNSSVTSSVLQAVSAYQDVSVTTQKVSVEQEQQTYGGNSVDYESELPSFGVNAVNQNTGISSNVQQAVTLNLTQPKL